jgi:hypothetical protein
MSHQREAYDLASSTGLLVVTLITKKGGTQKTVMAEMIDGYYSETWLGFFRHDMLIFGYHSAQVPKCAAGFTTIYVDAVNEHCIYSPITDQSDYGIRAWMAQLRGQSIKRPSPSTSAYSLKSMRLFVMQPSFDSLTNVTITHCATAYA